MASISYSGLMDESIGLEIDWTLVGPKIDCIKDKRVRSKLGQSGPKEIGTVAEIFSLGPNLDWDFPKKIFN